jgi:beta-glucosidase
VESGQLSNVTLDRAVSNILRKKFASLLFDQPPTDPAGVANINTAAHRELAREAARQGLTLLINRNATLPVDMSAVRNVAVVGELAGCDATNNGTSCTAKFGMLGGYQSGGVEVTSIEDAFRERGFNTTWVMGTAATDGQSADQAKQGIAEAVDLVASADLAVIAVGCIGECARRLSHDAIACSRVRWG